MSNGERTGRNRSNFEDRFFMTDFCGQRSYSSIDNIHEFISISESHFIQLEYFTINYNKKIVRRG